MDRERKHNGVEPACSRKLSQLAALRQALDLEPAAGHEPSRMVERQRWVNRPQPLAHYITGSLLPEARADY